MGRRSYQSQVPALTWECLELDRDGKRPNDHKRVDRYGLPELFGIASAADYFVRVAGMGRFSMEYASFSTVVLTMKGSNADLDQNPSPSIHGPGEQSAPVTHSERMRAFWKDPKFRKRVRDALIEALANPEARDRMAATMKRLWDDAVFRARNSERSKAMWADPIKRAQILERRKETLAAHPEIAHERSKRGWRTRDNKP